MRLTLGGGNGQELEDSSMGSWDCQYQRQYRNGENYKNMKRQAFNPYLPSWEYIPDGEPYVFDGRWYVYGSHDRFRGHAYYLNDYDVGVKRFCPLMPTDCSAFHAPAILKTFKIRPIGLLFHVFSGPKVMY